MVSFSGGGFGGIFQLRYCRETNPGSTGTGKHDQGNRASFYNDVNMLLGSKGLFRTDCFCGTQGGAELDLLVIPGARRIGFEFKRADSPKRTRSMLVALQSLNLDRIDVVYLGDRTYPLRERIRALPIDSLGDELAPLA